MSALGDDVNFDLIDDINSQHGAIDQTYETVPSDGTRNHGHGILTDSEIQGTQQCQFGIDAAGGLTSSSSDPKLFNPSSPEEPKTGFLTTVQKEQRWWERNKPKFNNFENVIFGKFRKIAKNLDP